MISHIRFFSIALILITLTGPKSYSSEREIEIKNLMWSSENEAFNRTEVPDKWKDQEAVVIAELNRFEYRKPAIINEFYIQKYFHKRIKLNHKNAVNEYSELNFPANNGKYLKVYVGFKLIKPDGTEKIIDPSQAVKMEQKDGAQKNAYMKIAIPNLEVGDILDYYICQDEAIQLASKMYFFDPVQFSLPQRYPVIEQNLEFKVQRRCFINLRSFNGAPELQLEVDEENDEQIYTLTDKDREAVKNQKWFYEYREVPSVKFRVAYASGKALRQNDVLLGEPGIVKNSITDKELTDFVTYLFTNTFTDPKLMLKHVKKTLPKNASNFEKAKAGYYFRRNQELQWAEVSTVSDKENWEQNLAMYKDNRIQFLDRFSGFLANLDIPYDIVIVIPRPISSLDDLLLESEIHYLIRVKQGDESLYFEHNDSYTIPGEINSRFMGTEAYIVDGLANFSDWSPERISIPATPKEYNFTEKSLEMTIGESFKKSSLDITVNVSGDPKPFHQHMLMDFYDYQQEERSRYEMKEDFKGTLWMQKRLLNLRESYMSIREERRLKILKQIAERDYSFDVDTVYNFNLEETGRFDTVPEMKYSFTLETEELIKKVGPNYILDAGKLIETQVKIESDERNREYGIHMNCPRAYKHNITIEIPDGYTVQGIEKLNYSIENSEGGFISRAKNIDGKLVIETHKYYNKLYAEKEAWPAMIKFLDAANQFTEQKVLFKKI